MNIPYIGQSGVCVGGEFLLTVKMDTNKYKVMLLRLRLYIILNYYIKQKKPKLTIDLN